MATKRVKRQVLQVDISDIKRSLKGELPDMKAIACSVYHQLGGADAFAKILVDALMNSKQSGMVQARIIDVILTCTKAVQAYERHEHDLGLLSDDDLTRELDKSVLKIAEKRPLAITHDEPGHERDSEAG